MINRELACLRHMFPWAAKRGYVDRSPLEALALLEEQEWAGPKPTDEVVQAVFDKLDPRFLPIFVVIRETGARRSARDSALADRPPVQDYHFRQTDQEREVDRGAPDPEGARCDRLRAAVSGLRASLLQP